MHSHFTWSVFGLVWQPFYGIGYEQETETHAYLVFVYDGQSNRAIA